jgi:putative FmdB family regulatory protein
MILHDYICRSCGSGFEAMVTVEQRMLECPCCHVGKADRVFKKVASMLGKNKGKYPYFDTQLGITLESSQHRDKVAKERGLVQMGPEEYNRSRHAPRTPHPMDTDAVDPNLIEIAKRTWDDVKFGRVPDEKEMVLDIVKDAQADFLDVNTAPQPN